MLRLAVAPRFATTLGTATDNGTSLRLAVAPRFATTMALAASHCAELRLAVAPRFATTGPTQGLENADKKPAPLVKKAPVGRVVAAHSRVFFRHRPESG